MFTNRRKVLVVATFQKLYREIKNKTGCPILRFSEGWEVL
jgi:hypothetical protein